MHTRIHQPEAPIDPDDLDAYLARGWYRIGQAMVTCRFVWSQEGGLRSAIWTRTRLSGYGFSRSLRRLHRKNLGRFRVTEGPLVIDDDREDLYRRYRAHARGSRPPTLGEALNGDSLHDRFDTREIGIYDDQDRLVAFSAFDIGQDSLQSLMGVYDPALSTHSLGFWTLLLEVEHAQSLGLSYHYAGYVLPGDPSMDYKLRLGHMEFLDPDEHVWRPWQDFEHVELPTERLDRALHAVRVGISRQAVSSRLVSYRFYEAPAWSPALRQGLDQPRVVLVAPRDKSTTDIVVTYDLDAGRYNVLRCLRAEGVTAAEGVDSPRRVALWVVGERLATAADPDIAAVEAVRHATR